jgi:hypothetical protein
VAGAFDDLLMDGYFLRQILFPHFLPPAHSPLALNDPVLEMCSVLHRDRLPLLRHGALHFVRETSRSSG